jgi:hypothetical protein
MLAASFKEPVDFTLASAAKQERHGIGWFSVS